MLNQQVQDKHLFQFSHNHRSFTFEELAQNLCALLPSNTLSESASLKIEEVLKDPELLLYRRIKHLFNCDCEDTWYKGTVLSYNQQTEEF